MSAQASPQARRVSDAALRLLKLFEGERLEAARLSEAPSHQGPSPQGSGANGATATAARWVIGVGHVVEGAKPAPLAPKDVDALLRCDLEPLERLIDDSVLAPLNQHQFDALACLAFNIGAEAFRASDVLARVNEGAWLDAALAFDTWRCVEQNGRRLVVDALVRRRAAEKALFLTPEYPVPAASSAHIRPVSAAFEPIVLPRTGRDPVEGDVAALSGSTFSSEASPEAETSSTEVPPAIAARRRADAHTPPPRETVIDAQRQREWARWCVLIAGLAALVALGSVFEVLQAAARDASAGPWPGLAALAVVLAAVAGYAAWRPQILFVKPLSLGVF